MCDDRHLSLENPSLDSQAQAVPSTRNKIVKRGLAFMACGMLQSCCYRHRLKKLKAFSEECQKAEHLRRQLGTSGQFSTSDAFWPYLL